MTIDRKELYDLIWTNPASQLCLRFGISDVGLAKICKRHGIPLPPRGHWAKKRNGKPTRRIPLPPASDARLEKIDIFPTPVREKQVLPPAIEERITAEKAAGIIVVVRDRLTSPHPLVESTRSHLASSKPDQLWGLVRAPQKGCLDVAVGPESIGRSMRIMDALIKTLESRGNKVRIIEQNSRQTTVVEVDGEIIPFRMTERVERKLRPPNPDSRRAFFDTKYMHLPTGDLRLQILSEHGGYPVHTWQDGAQKAIEDHLSEFILGIVETSLQLKARREQARLAKIEEERRRKIWEEQERLRREEEERVRSVEATLETWMKRRNLTTMIQEAKARASELGYQITPESRMGKWIDVAERRAAKLDPFAPMLAELPPLEVGKIEDALGESVGPVDDREVQQSPSEC